MHLGPDALRDLQELHVRDALQEGVGDGGDHDVHGALVAAGQLLGGGKVAPAALDALLPKAGHVPGVDVDDVDPLKDPGVPNLELSDEQRSDFVEAEENDVPVLFLEDLFPLIFVRDVQGASSAQGWHRALHDADHGTHNLLVVADGTTVEDRQNDERPHHDRHCCFLDVAKAAALEDAHAADDDGELADLRDVDRGEGGDPRLAAHGQEEPEYADPPYRQHDHHDQDGLRDDIHFGHGHVHPDAGEEERDEKVPDVLDLAVEVLAVGEGGQGAACNDRGELHGEAHEGQDRRAADEEAPGEREHEHQLDALGGVQQDGGHHELRVRQRYGDEDDDHEQVLHDLPDVGLMHSGLNGKHHNRPDVLAHEDAIRHDPCW
mmetsp:Transcript_72900/g.225440  ORF Transcript_72900/g.225440 Transcript_72900/m.225440 type:complete len:377 (-) Transcript_72900:461-1591(-)